MEFNSNFTLTHLNTCGLIRIRLHLLGSGAREYLAASSQVGDAPSIADAVESDDIEVPLSFVRVLLLSLTPCLVLKNFTKFSDSSLHQTLQHIHITLNINKINN